MPEGGRRGGGRRPGGEGATSPANPRGDGGSRAHAHAFWSGTIAFGLVAVPVHLYSALRRDRVSLRMVDADGTPLERRYYCSVEGVPIGSGEIVRGYEIGEGAYVVVEDEELERLAPEASREIDLRRFVPRAEVDAARFERAYVLAPEEGATKPYRLLAQALEATDRVGIATFVMRDKEHLVAIMAERGLLLAETLRFDDELRSAEEVGLAEPAAAPAARVAEIARELEALRADALDPRELTDRQGRRLRNLVAAKLEANDDVLRAMAPAAADGEADDGGDTAPPDLMRILKRSLARTGADEEGRGGAQGDRRPQGQRAGAGAGPSRQDLMRHTKDELYERAKELDVSGRSRMTKRELVDAIRR